MTQLKETILKGWPIKKSDCPKQIQDYWSCIAELSVVNDISFKGNKFDISASMHKEMLQKVHKGHLGEEKCKRRAREVMYWPRMNHKISQTTASWEICLIYRSRQQAEPIMPHPVPDHPYQKFGVDLFDCNGKSHIVGTDYFSNYPEVATLQVTSSQAVIAFLKTVFSRHGVPCEVFSDNGPQFCSREFDAFAKEWGFQHTTSSPNYPRSNRLAESSVKIVKALMKKSRDGKTDFHQSLMIYSSAPHQKGLSPVQMLMGRRIRTNLPIHQDLLTLAGVNKIKEAKQQLKNKQKENYDKKAKTLQKLKPGDRVRILNHATGTRSCWKRISTTVVRDSDWALCNSKKEQRGLKTTSDCSRSQVAIEWTRCVSHFHKWTNWQRFCGLLWLWSDNGSYCFTWEVLQTKTHCQISWKVNWNLLTVIKKNIKKYKKVNCENSVMLWLWCCYENVIFGIITNW